MTLSQRLSEFKFNLETIDLLTSMGRTSSQIVEEVSSIGFTSSHVQFISQSRTLLQSVLLRLQLYGEQNLKESTVRTNLNVLNNTVVNSLLDSMFFPKNETVPVKKNETVAAVKTAQVDQTITNEEEDEVVEESSRFEQFFRACVKQTNDMTDVVKTTDFHNAFAEWWGGIYEESVPDKNELKEFLSNKLGKSNKNTWSNVCLA